MTDNNTGKPRGYGFATYADADSAASAVRNLNDYEVGGRKIRVDWPHQNNKDSVPQNYEQDNTSSDNATNGQAAQTALPPMPQGVDLQPNIRVTDAISQTLNALPPQTLLDVLTQMKSLAISEPAKTTEILRQQPQLAYAIFQALLLMGLVDDKIFQQVLEQPQAQARAAPVPLQPPPILPPQQHPHPFPPPIPQQHQQYPAFPPPLPGQQPPSMQPRPQYGAPPPVPQHVQQPPPAQQPQQPLSQDQMIQQILAMDQRTIDSLPPNDRAQIMALRSSYGVR